jgi:transposase
VGHPPEVPVTGQRKSVKILGAVELWKARFHYQRDSVFNAETYLAFLEGLAGRYRRQGAILIQDNASYHKKRIVWDWFADNRDWLEVHNLPPYSPEFNPTERLWKYTRKNGTHNRYFENESELLGTLTKVFGDMQVGSRTGAVFRRSSLAVAPRFLWECLNSPTVNPFPVPATSHPACRFPALGAPVCLVPRVMWPIVLGRLSHLTIDRAGSC